MHRSMSGISLPPISVAKRPLSKPNLPAAKKDKLDPDNADAAGFTTAAEESESEDEEKLPLEKSFVIKRGEIQNILNPIPKFENPPRPPPLRFTDKTPNVVSPRIPQPMAAPTIVEKPRINIHEFNSIFKSDGKLIEREKIRHLFSEMNGDNILLQHIIDELVLHNWRTVAVDLYSIAQNSSLNISQHSAYEALILSNNILYQTQGDNADDIETPDTPYQGDRQPNTQFDTEISMLDSISNITIPQKSKSKASPVENAFVESSRQVDGPNQMLPLSNRQIMFDFLLNLSDDILNEYVEELKEYITHINGLIVNPVIANITPVDVKDSIEPVSSATIAIDIEHMLGDFNGTLQPKSSDSELKGGLSGYVKNTGLAEGGVRGITSEDLSSKVIGVLSSNITPNKADTQNSFITGGYYTRQLLTPYINNDPYLHGQSLITLKAEADHDIDESRTKTKPDASLKLQNTDDFFKGDTGVKQLINTSWETVLTAQHSVVTGAAEQNVFWKDLYTQMHNSPPKDEDDFVSRIFKTMANNNIDLPVCNPCTIFKTSAIQMGTSTDLTKLLTEAQKIYAEQISPYYADSNVILYLKTDGTNTTASIYIYVFNKGDGLDFTKLVHTNDMNIDGRELLLIGGKWKEIMDNTGMDTGDAIYEDPYSYFIDADNNINEVKLRTFSEQLDTQANKYNNYQFINNAKITDPANLSSGNLTLYNQPIDIEQNTEYCITQTKEVIELFKKHLTESNIGEYKKQLTDVFQTNRIEGGALSNNHIASITIIDDDMSHFVLESFERKGYLAVINEVMSDWFTDGFFITTCKPVIIENGYKQIEFIANIKKLNGSPPVDLLFMLEVNKSTVLNICVFMETIHILFSKNDLFINKIVDVKSDTNIQSALIDKVIAQKNDLTKHGNEALYSILIMLLNSLHLLHNRFNNVTVLQLMIIFIGFIKSIGDKKQILICSTLNKMFAEGTGATLGYNSDNQEDKIEPFKMYVASKDRNFAGQCCIYDALFAAIGNFMNVKTENMNISPAGGSNHTLQVGGARTEAIKVSAPLVISYGLRNACIEQPETEEQKQTRLTTKKQNDFLNVKSHIALKLGLEPDIIKLYKSGAELGVNDIAEYNNVFFALQKYNSAITVNDNTIDSDANLLFAAKVQQKINTTFTRAQLEYIRELTNRSLPSEPNKLVRYIVSFLLGESQLVDILINILDETLSDLTIEYQEYIKTIGNLSESESSGAITVSNSVYLRLQTANAYYTKIIDNINGIHIEFITKLQTGIDMEKRVLVSASQRSTRDRTQNTYRDGNVNENLIEDLDENLKDVEETLNILNQRSTNITKIQNQLTKLGSIKTHITQVSQFRVKLSEWINEITQMVKTPTPEQAITNVVSTLPVIVQDPNKKPAELLKEIINAISKPLKSTQKNVSKDTQDTESKKTKLTSRISKLTRNVLPGKKTVEVLNSIADRVNTSTTLFANRITGLFGSRTGGSTTRGGKLHLFAIKPIHTSRKTHNKQNNKRSNRRIRKLGVLTRKRNSVISKTKQNRRRTIHLLRS